MTNDVSDPRLKQTPVVLLNDCLSDRIKSLGKRKFVGSNEDPSNGLTNGFLEESVNGLLTPGPSNSSRSENSHESMKKKRRSRKEEYEVEKIVGYHIDKKNKITYLLKWKGWDSKYNTFQSIEDMGNCNKLLMEFFEFEKPSAEEYAKMDKEVGKSVSESRIYRRLIRTNYKKSEFLRFMSTPTPDLSLIFSDSFEPVYRELKKEYEYIIRCLIGMWYHRDPGMFARAEQYRLALNICEMRRKQLKVLKAQEEEINRIENCRVAVVNDKDLDVLPEDVRYMTNCTPGKGVQILNDPYVGCNCKSGCSPKSKCCPVRMESEFPYSKSGKLRIFTGPIYECNRRCQCPPDCRNRVVQHGRNIPVAIFKTELCGWGVKTLQNIEKGTFVCEYYGEVISEMESVVRETDYVPKNLSYIFDLDFTPNRETTLYCIDATKGGNFARYMNHSCDPNLIVRPVWINCPDPYMPQLGFFARRNIRKGEELSFDYENKVDSSADDSFTEKSTKRPSAISRNRCYCNKPKCREWLFGSL